MYASRKYVAFFVTVLACSFLFAKAASAATYYVNADSSGAASGPTKPFSDPTYTANDSYATLSAAYTAASNGDTIELSGGSSGKTYTGLAVYKSLVIRGSRIPNHSGMVTIDGGAAGYSLGLVADNMVLENVTVSRSVKDGQEALEVYNQNAVIRDVTISNTSAGILVIGTANGTVLERVYFDGKTISGVSLHLYSAVSGNSLTFSGRSDNSSYVLYNRDNAGNSVFNNCTFSNSRPMRIYNSTLTFNNCSFTDVRSAGGLEIFYFMNANGVVATNNSLIQGEADHPSVFKNGVGTWNSSGDIINGFPYFTRTRENKGFITIGVDDVSSLTLFSEMAQVAARHGITMSMYVSETYSLDANEKALLQSLYKAGHDIGAHTRRHSNLSRTAPFNCTYTGLHADIALVVSDSGTALELTGSGDTQGPIDLTSPAYNTLEEVVNYLESLPNYTCSLYSSSENDLPSSALKDVSIVLPVGVATAILYDDRDAEDNRLFSYEIGGAISDLENAVHEDPSSSAYVTRSLTFPFNASTAAAVNWIRTHTDILAARDSSGVSQSGATIETVGLYDASVILGYGTVKGAGYDSLTSQEKKSRTEQAARVLTTRASNGEYLQTYFHNGEITAEEFGWFLDEVMKYASLYNVTVASMADVASEIMTSGEWTDVEEDDIWTRTFTGTANYVPYYLSPLIDSGTSVVGRTTDYLANPIYGLPDIGAYEYQPPYTMGSNEPDISADVRVYGDGKFRNTKTAGGMTSDLSIIPESGDTADYLDVDITNWNTSGTRLKQWTETSGTHNLTTVHTIGDLTPKEYYTVSYTKDGGSKTELETLQADSSGRIYFTYDKGYSSVVFDVEPYIEESTHMGGHRRNVSNLMSQPVPLRTELQATSSPNVQETIASLQRQLIALLAQLLELYQKQLQEI